MIPATPKMEIYVILVNGKKLLSNVTMRYSKDFAGVWDISMKLMKKMFKNEQKAQLYINDSN